MKRGLAKAGIAILVLLIVGISIMWSVVRWQQSKAQRLYALATALRVGESTLDQSLELTRSFKSTHNSEKCELSECRFKVGMTNFLMNDDFSTRWFNSSILRRLGLRPAGTIALITVTNGTVQSVHVEAFYQNVSRAWVRAVVEFTDSFTAADSCVHLGLLRHPTYLVTSGHSTDLHMNGAYLRTTVTPGATPRERERAQFIDFRCMTTWSSCSAASPYLSAIAGPFMPLAYQELLADEAWEEAHAAESKAFLSKCHAEGLGGIAAN